MNHNHLSIFTDQMQAGKDLAMARRAKGLPAGNPAAGHARKRADYGPTTDNDQFCYLVKAGWRVESGVILDDFRRFLYPERYEEFN